MYNDTFFDSCQIKKEEEKTSSYQEFSYCTTTPFFDSCQNTKKKKKKKTSSYQEFLYWGPNRCSYSGFLNNFTFKSPGKIPMS